MQHRNVVITGGTGGLGREVTKAIVARGANVVIPVYSTAEVSGLRDRLGLDIDRINFVPTDLRDEDQVARLFDEMPSVEGLVHLVGGFASGELHCSELATLDRLLALNVTTTYLALKHAVRRMRENRYGRIVTVSSRSAIEPVPSMAIYSATKAAVLAMTQALAEESKNHQITANVVLPTIIDTPTNRDAMGEQEAEKWVKPARLAETIAYLLSEAAGDLRGTAVRVYGRV